MKTGIVILAAGNSSRLGRPKQLLKIGDKTLLEIVMEAAITTSFGPVVVVLGAYANMLTHTNPEVRAIHNPDWEKGLSTSIAVGINYVLKLDPETDNVIIAVSDQPFIKDKIFKSLEQRTRETGKNIIASAYQETKGTPVLFNKKYFNELANLTGNGGAKDMLRKYANDLETINFDRGEIDIDTEKDYTDLTSNI